jgi:subtilisin family serine protease
MLATLRSLALFLAIVPVVGSVGQASASSLSQATTGTARVLVRFDAHTTTAAQNAALARAGARRLNTIGQLRIAIAGVPARAEKTTIRELGASPIVAYVERDGRVHGDGASVDDPYLNPAFWQLGNLGFPDAWSLSTGSASIIVAVLDSGVDRRHEDLGAFVPGHNFADGGANTSDDNGHGTAVTGIIAAQGGNGKGIAGVCWKCRVMPVKVLGADNSGSWSDVAAGVIWATKHGARVINMSLGLPSGSRSIAAAVSYAESHNVVVVASAGNENSSKRDYPAAYPGVLSVGAVDETGTRYATSNGNVQYGKWGSNYGSWVDVDAPGCVNSTWPASSSHPSGDYTYFCGTSAAAPFVAGLAGLALSYVPTASATEVVDAIESTAHQTGDRNSAHGLIDAKATLTALAALPPGSTVSFTPNAVSGKAPVTIRFANTSTKAGPYSWSFGDGKTSTGASPKHLYKRPGTYTATLTSTNSDKSASVSISVAAARTRSAGGKISVRLSKKTFRHSQAAKVKLTYRFSSPSESFKYRLERKSGSTWQLVRSVRRNGGFRGSHSLTVKQLFGGTTIETGRYRLVLSGDANQSLLGFETT